MSFIEYIIPPAIELIIITNSVRVYIKLFKLCSHNDSNSKSTYV